MAQILAKVTEKLSLSSALTPTRGVLAELFDLAILGGGKLGPRLRRKAKLVDKLTVTGKAHANSAYHLQLTSALSFSGRVVAGMTATLRARFKLHEARLQTTHRSSLHGTLQLAGRLRPQLRFTTRLIDALLLRERGVRHMLGGLLRAALTLTDRVRPTYRAIAHMKDGLAVADQLDVQLSLIALLRDDTTIADSLDVSAIFAAFLSDRVDFLLEAVDPSGDVTTWAMNARTGAVSEYLNFAFNSFAVSRAGTYLAANDTGLYELVGADDAGEAVIADIIGGLVDFGGAFLSGIQAAYLGVRGEGKFYLRLTSGTGKTYLYGVTAQSLRVARINLGKGLRDRYYTYQLTSVGQDFDLTDILFLPLQFTRRV